MKLNKLLVTFLVFILLVSSIYAESPPDQGSSGSDYDYSSDDSYSDPDFYSNSDPSRWDYSKVDWEKVDFNRAEIYSSPEFYNNIPDDRYRNLDYKQVEFSQIKDHSKIDPAKYFKDMGCSGCYLDKGGQKVIFSKKGITHPNGNSVSIPGNYPSGCLFVATKNRIEVIVPEDAETISVPTVDKVTINIQGRDITLADGTKVSGKLSYDKGQAYVKAGDVATINGIKISTQFIDQPEYINDILVFFDGEEHKSTEDYVSLNAAAKKLTIQADSDYGMNLVFMKTNPFVKIEEGDKVRISGTKEVILALKNRDEQGLIPQVIIRTTAPDGAINLDSGKISIELYNGKAYSSVFTSEKASSSPMSLEIYDESGKTLVGTKTEPKKVLINNYNEMVTVPLKESEGYTKVSESYDFAPSLVSERLSVSYKEYTFDSFKKEFPNIYIEGELDSATIKRLTETLRHLPPEIRSSIRGFKVFTKGYWEAMTQRIFGSPQSTGAYTSGDRVIRIPNNGLYYSVIYHEAAHDLTFRIEQEEEAKIAQARLDGKPVNFKTFEEEWKTIAGYIYGEGLGEKRAGLGLTWADGSYEPRYGFVRPYGANDYLEDIATFVENVYKNPDFYKPLISQDISNSRVLELQTPGGTPLYYRTKVVGGKQKVTLWSPDRSNWMDLSTLKVSGGLWEGEKPTDINQEIITKLNNAGGDVNVLLAAARENNVQVTNAQYDVRYRQKLDLLYQKGFITKERYEYITGGIK